MDAENVQARTTSDLRRAPEARSEPRWPLLARLRAEISPRILLTLAAVAAGLWLFAELADEVGEGTTHELDQALLLALRTPGVPSEPVGPPWVEELARDVTALGGVGVLVLLTAAVAGYLALLRLRGATLFVLAATCGGWALSFGLKGAFERPRPALVPHMTEVYSASFPSGHSMMSAVTYLTLAALLGRVHRKRRLQIYLFAWALAASAVIGASRVYLGVHWPTDVVAGWALGASWALLCWTLAVWLERRHGAFHPSRAAGRADLEADATATAPDVEPTHSRAASSARD